MTAVMHGLAATRCCKTQGKLSLGVLECKENACIFNKLVCNRHCGNIWWWEGVCVAIIYLQAFPSWHLSCMVLKMQMLQNSLESSLDVCECKENACILDKLVFHSHFGEIWWWEGGFVAIIHPQDFPSWQLSSVALQPQGDTRIIAMRTWCVWVQRKCLHIE